MPVRAAEQSKRTMCIALYNRELHKNNKCPRNYEVEYNRGWFYVQYGSMDPYPPEHRPDITSEADEKLAAGWEVLFSREANTYFLGDPPLSDDDYNGEDNE